MHLLCLSWRPAVQLWTRSLPRSLQGTELIESLSAIEGTAIEKVEAFTNLLISEGFTAFARSVAPALAR